MNSYGDKCILIDFFIIMFLNFSLVLAYQVNSFVKFCLQKISDSCFDMTSSTFTDSIIVYNVSSNLCTLLSQANSRDNSFYLNCWFFSPSDLLFALIFGVNFYFDFCLNFSFSPLYFKIAGISTFDRILINSMRDLTD